MCCYEFLKFILKIIENTSKFPALRKIIMTQQFGHGNFGEIYKLSKGVAFKKEQSYTNNTHEKNIIFLPN